MLIYNSSKGYGAIPQAVHWLTVILVAVASFRRRFAQRCATWCRAICTHIRRTRCYYAACRSRGLESGRPTATRRTDNAWRLVRPFGEGDSLPALCSADAVPVAGVVLQFARGDAIPVFGLVEIASPWLKDRAFSKNVEEVHEVLAHTLMVVAGFHVAAALIHHWVLRDRTLRRMLPRFGD